jgi:nucleotide-binding universal stress UspA family protein
MTHDRCFAWKAPPVARYCVGDVAPSGLEIPGGEPYVRMNDAAPILIAYDGSDTARRAVHEAAELFGSRRALVVTVWERGLAYEVGAMAADSTGQGPAPVDTAAAQEVDDASQAHAHRLAEDGAQLAKSLGLQAEPLAIADEGNVADAIVELARKRDVAAIVVGSRGLTGLRARLEGSTSSGVAKHASCPVVLVHHD